MDELSQYVIQPELRLRDGRIIATIAEAAAYVREHELRPGVDARDEILHRLERAQTKDQGEAAAEAFLSWLEGLDLVDAPPGVAQAQRDTRGTYESDADARETENAGALVGSAVEALKGAISDQTTRSADYLDGFVGSLRRASREFENEMPVAGQYIQEAASRIDTVADAFRTRDTAELVKQVRDFARREPALVVCGAVLAGFAVVRFLRSSRQPST